MRDQILIWAGAAAVVAVYLLMCASMDKHQADLQRCSVVRCA